MSEKIRHLLSGSGPPPTQDEQIAAFHSIGINPYVAVIGNETLKEFSFIHDLAASGAMNKMFSENDWKWHSDMSYIERPVRYSLLYAEKPSETGGATSFASMVAASNSWTQAAILPST